MALFARKDSFLDQPSEDVIDLSAEEAAAGIGGPSGRAGGARGGFSGKITDLRFLGTFLFLTVLAVGWLFFYNAELASRDTKYIAESSQMLMLSQRIAKDAREAVQGRETAFKTLTQSRRNFQNIITALMQGNPEKQIQKSPRQVEAQLKELQLLWDPPGTEEGTADRVDHILGQEQALFSLRDHVLAINQLAPLLLSITDEIVELGVKAGMSQRYLYLAGRQGMLSQRIAKDVNLFAQGGDDAAVAAAQFGKDSKLFKDSEKRLRNAASPSIRSKLDEAAEVFQEMNSHVEGILSNAAELFVSQRASQQIFAQSDELSDKVASLVDAYGDLEKSRDLFFWMALGLSGLSVILVFLIAWRLVNDEKDRARASAEEGGQTQDAILKLLDEMGNLADGDLTVEPEVTEQITGAIADSINFAVKEMRNLVYRIKNAAQQVAMASESSRQTATELTEAALRQAAQITDTTEKVQAMARSMEDMSQSAEKSAEVAQGSVSTAKRGAEAVQNTIHGMDQMREQIQETSKRIKRLGESSQQIGEIVELINDIAEQTNILSLNAAIQAAMAGEAGRGFAVVADEVQRLAERSAEATKQISDLVKTIQADTNEAVASMEQATNGVVETTRLADGAGQALGEIESVSEQLSDLIVGIAKDALHQSENASEVSGSMAKIQETTTLTSSGTRQTAESIGKLSDLARELQASVAGFKLPA